ncbi:MAG: hypothetical protein ACFE9Z_16025 [Promethearchaeota archaeon]
MKTIERRTKLVLMLLVILGITLPALVHLSVPNVNKQITPKSSSLPEIEDFSSEAHGTSGLDIDFIDEYHGYGSGYYCDHYISDGPFGDHSKVLIVRDAQGALNTWSVHYLDESLYLGYIKFSLWLNGGGSCTNPHYHYIKFRDNSDTVAFQLRFDLYTNNAYYYSGSTWSLIATLTKAEWYRYNIDFNINSHTFNIEIKKETTGEIAGKLFDRPYENNVPIEEVYIGTTVNHYSGNSRWDDFEFGKDEYSDTLRPNQEVQIQWEYSDVTYIDEEIEKPNPGDGNSNSHSGYSEYKTDIFGMDTIGLDRRVASINVHLLCVCDVYLTGFARIKIYYRIGNEGAWSSEKVVSSPFSKDWVSFRWDGLSLSKSDIDNLQIRLTAEISTTGLEGGVSVDTMYVEIEHIPEKIGVFFWASDAGTSAGNIAYEEEIANHVYSYRDVLIQEGYTKFFMIPDVDDDDLNDEFNNVKAFEYKSDSIFFYFWGHGNVDGSHSFVKLNCYIDYRRCDLYSYSLIYILNSFESSRIGYLVESCKSGYFVEDLDDNPFLAISSSDHLLNSYSDILHEGRFSNHFWDAVGNDYDAYMAYVNANYWNQYYSNPIWIIIFAPLWWPYQNPQYDNNLYDHTGYMFFA